MHLGHSFEVQEIDAVADGFETGLVHALAEDLREIFDLAILLISHDMSVVQQLCDRVAVMYLRELVERGPTADLYDDRKHPFTRALLDAVPKPDPPTDWARPNSRATCPTPRTNPPDADSTPDARP
jgi:peptide/nickel transport system ATP-binding protein